jgi:hypothetical protein
MNGEISFYDNRFVGDSQSPVAFQMLEGLQPGKNMTWRLLLQKNLWIPSSQKEFRNEISIYRHGGLVLLHWLPSQIKRGKFFPLYG